MTSVEPGRFRVVHLIASCIASHGPTGGILAQITADRSGRYQWSVWGMYPPEPGMSAQDAVRGAGARFHEFGMSRSFVDLRVLLPLAAQLRREKPDVLHCHLVRANLYGRLAGRLSGVPVIISTLRNVEDYFTGQDAVSRAVRFAERATAGMVSRYVAVSEGVRRAAIERLRISPDSISTVLNALDLRPFERVGIHRAAVRAELGLESHQVVVGTVSVLETRKNVGQLLNAVAAISSAIPSIRLLIVGSGPEERDLKAAAARVGLDRVVKFAGLRRDVWRVLQAFDVFALASRNEGLPRAVMEAMAAGLPCVVTDVGGNAEAVRDGETGFVVPYGSDHVFVERIQALVESETLRRRMGEAARTLAFRDFAAERMAREYDRLYVDLLEKGKV